MKGFPQRSAIIWLCIRFHTRKYFVHTVSKHKLLRDSWLSFNCRKKRVGLDYRYIKRHLCGGPELHVSAIVSSLKTHYVFLVAWHPFLCPSVCKHLLQNHRANFSKPCTNYPWVKGKEIYVLYQEGIIAFFIGELIAKIHGRHLKILFSRTRGPNSTSLGTAYPCVKGIISLFK